MTLKELKTNVINNTLTDDFLVLVCEDNFFIANQYVDMICKNKCLSKIFISSIFEGKESALSLVFNYDNTLNILKVDKFDEYAEDYSKFTNTIVVCNDIDKKIKDKIDIFCVTIPKLVDWQLEEYVKTLCNGLDEDEIKFLVKSTNNDIYKLENEVQKLMLFSKNEQKDILNELKCSPDSGYITFSPFDLCSALVSKDFMRVGTCLYYRKYCDFDSVHLVSILLNQYKLMLYIGFNSGLTVEQLGINKYRAYYLKQDVQKYSQEKIKKIIKLLTNFDQQLKTGLMDISKDRQTDYIISNLINIIL